MAVVICLCADFHKGKALRRMSSPFLVSRTALTRLSAFGTAFTKPFLSRRARFLVSVVWSMSRRPVSSVIVASRAVRIWASV